MPVDYASSALVPPTTDAASIPFTLSHNEVPARLSASGLGAAETIPVKVVDGPDGVATAISQGGTALELAEDNNVVVLTAPGPYLVEKGATAGDVGVFLAKG